MANVEWRSTQDAARNESHPEADRIVGTILDGITALRQRDPKGWVSKWVQTPYARRVGRRNFDAAGAAVVPNAGLYIQDGWDEIWPAMQPLFDNDLVSIYPRGCPVRKLVRAGQGRYGLGDVRASTRSTPTARRRPTRSASCAKSRVMGRDADQWKFTYMGFFHEIPQRPAEAAVRLDEHAAITGMTRAAAERIGESEVLRVRNGRLRAADRHVDARLLAVIGDVARTSPWSTGTVCKPFLIKTPWGTADCLCWISSSLDMTGSAIITFGEQFQPHRRLHNAIRVYRLSPAQARLAERIIDGHDLVAAAEQLGVTVNTARTHLHRMFEKTGVRSQPALVGALLSVAAPLD